MNIAYITANFGRYDKVSEFEFTDSEIDYYVFADSTTYEENKDAYDINGFQPKVRDYIVGSNRDAARKIKTNLLSMFSMYDVVIWADSSFNQKHSLIPLIENFNEGRNDLLLVSHPTDNCLYLHGDKCVAKAVEGFGVVETMKKKYEKDGYPKNNGLFASGFFMVKPNEKTKKMFDDWHFEVYSGSKRDQISLPYVLWKSGANYATIDFEDIYKLFELKPHNK